MNRKEFTKELERLVDIRARTLLTFGKGGSRAKVPRGPREKRVEGPVRTYFIQRGETGPVKIGRSRDVHARLRQLTTGSAEPLHIRGVIEGDFEAVLHTRLWMYCISGEWFYPEPAVFAAMNELRAMT